MIRYRCKSQDHEYKIWLPVPDASSLISLIVSVDVKYRVYYLLDTTQSIVHTSVSKQTTPRTSQYIHFINLQLIHTTEPPPAAIYKLQQQQQHKQKQKQHTHNNNNNNNNKTSNTRQQQQKAPPPPPPPGTHNNNNKQTAAIKT